MQLGLPRHTPAKRSTVRAIPIAQTSAKSGSLSVLRIHLLRLSRMHCACFLGEPLHAKRRRVVVDVDPAAFDVGSVAEWPFAREMPLAVDCRFCGASTQDIAKHSICPSYQVLRS